MSEPGATPASPADQRSGGDDCFIVREDGTKSPPRKHIWSWRWKNGQMVDLECSACLKTKEVDPTGGSGDAS